jgi:predicted transcriptional regulator
MFDVDEFTITRLYKNIWEKSRLKLAPKLRDRGLSVQEMAELLEIDVEVIRKYLQENF